MSVKTARSDPPEPPDLLALPPGARVLEFEIERVIGRGGFSIVYLAFDHSLHRRVALKEYLPDTLARRDATLTVVPFSSKHQETFDVGLKSFLKEARLLARFDHPSLVKVYRFWEASGTAYMAMPHYEGSTLRDAFRHGPRPDARAVETMTMKLLDAVELLHRGECLHRDIAPDNVILQRNGNPVLLDFGAARRIIREKTQALTVILKTGFAPIEQYSEEGEMEQGPWTDVYALAATLYAVITGKGPPACVSRAYNDPYVPLGQVAPPGYSPQFTSGIDQALAFLPEKRPQTIAAFRDALGVRDRPASPKPGAIVAAPLPKPSEPVAAPLPKPSAPVAVPLPKPEVAAPPPAPEVDERTVLVPRTVKRSGLRRTAYVAIAAGVLVTIGVVLLYRPGQDAPAVPGETQVAARAPSSAASSAPTPAPVPTPVPPSPKPGTTTASAPEPTPVPTPPPMVPAPKPPPAAVISPQPPVAPAPSATAPPRERSPVERSEPAPPKAATPAPVSKPPASAPAPGVAERKPPESSPIPVPGPIAPPPSSSPSPPVTAPEPPTVVAKVDPAPREPADPAEAAKAYRQRAEEGDARAQTQLGFAYQNGNGVAVDYAAARKWYEAAAAQGNAAAQNNLGNLHAAGLGVARNPVLAAEWYRKSANQGYAIAQNNLGLMLETGRGTFRDTAGAAELFRRAAESGNINAMYNLARLYETGTGVPKSRDDALKWFQAAAQKGQKAAVARLAELSGK